MSPSLAESPTDPCSAHKQQGWDFKHCSRILSVKDSLFKGFCEHSTRKTVSTASNLGLLSNPNSNDQYCTSLLFRNLRLANLFYFLKQTIVMPHTTHLRQPRSTGRREVAGTNVKYVMLCGKRLLKGTTCLDYASQFGSILFAVKN